MNSIESSESEKKQEERSKSPTPSLENNDEDENCSICLEQIQNKSFADKCFHKFCFTCLVQWSKVKPECPLCKMSFSSILHNIRSMSDYDQYNVPKPRTSQDNRQFLQHYANFFASLLDFTILARQILSGERRDNSNEQTPTTQSHEAVSNSSEHIPTVQSHEAVSNSSEHIPTMQSHEAVSNSSEHIPAMQSHEARSPDSDVIPLQVCKNQKCEKTPGTVDSSSDDECEIVYVKKPETSNMNAVNKNALGKPSDNSLKTVEKQSDPCSSSSNNNEQENSQSHKSPSNSIIGVVKPQRSTVIQHVVCAVANEGIASTSSSIIGVVQPKRTTVREFFYDAANKDTPLLSSLKPKKRKTSNLDDVPKDNDDASSSLLKPKKQRVLNLDDISRDDRCDVLNCKECEISTNMNTAKEKPVDFSLKKFEAEPNTSAIYPCSSSNIHNYEHNYCRLSIVKTEKITD